MMELFAKAALIGFCIAAPIGPCGLLCISRSLKGGLRSGVATGLGVTLADAVFAALGAFGVTALINVLERWAGPLRVGGALFLIFLGVRIALTRPHVTENGAVAGSARSDLVSSFLVTLANPLTIFAFVAIFAGLGVGQGGGWEHALTVVLGVACGSLTWWVLLSWMASFFGRRLHPEWVARVGQYAGWIIAALGVLALVAVGA